MKNISFNQIYTIKIGQNAIENDILLKEMKDNDTWFHLSEYSSPHLIINTDFNFLTKKDIYQIAVILKQHTKYKKDNHIAITYTLRKNLELTTTPGLVNLIGKHYNINV